MRINRQIYIPINTKSRSEGRPKSNPKTDQPCLERYSSIPFAADLPAPMARITVAAPVTASPPAKTPSRVVISDSLTMMPPRLLTSRPAVVVLMSGLGDVPRDMMTASQSMMNSEPGTSTGLLLPEASGSPNSILMHLQPFTQPFSSARISTGLVRRSKIMPSSFA